MTVPVDLEAGASGCAPSLVTVGPMHLSPYRSRLKRHHPNRSDILRGCGQGPAGAPGPPATCIGF